MSSWPPIKDIAKQVNSGQLNAVDNVNKALDLIKQQGDYQSIIAPIVKRSITRAEAIKAKVKSGKSGGRLAGVPFIAKDNFLCFGPDTTAASNILKGFSAPYQSTAINRLEAEGAICVGKANLDAFAHGASTENSDFFVTKNPHDKSRVPGGSSGGSAASVALRLTPFAVGTDTGGFIRQPASFSGCVGYKPSYGLVSRSGVVAMASSTDCIGTLAMTVEDSALALDIMAGRDELDSTTIERQPDYTDFNDALKTKKIALLKEYMDEGLDSGVKKVIESAVAKLTKSGYQVEEVSIPDVGLALAVYYIICPAEVSSNLARYDGQRFGYSYPGAADLEQSYKLSRGNGFGEEAKRRIMIGTYVLSSGYYDQYYRKAQLVRTKLINEFSQAFSKYDFILGPVAPTSAFKIGENTASPLKMYLCDIMTVAANIVGCPAISIPAGKLNNLPVGLQIMAPIKHDKQLLNFANKVERLLQ